MALLWLIVTQDFPPGFVGGVASWCEDLAAALHGAGEEVVVLARRTGKTHEADALRPYEVVRMRGRSWGSWQGLWAAAHGLLRLGRDVVVIAATWRLATGLAPLARRAGTRLAIGFHGSELTRQREPGPAFSRTVSAATALLPVSPFLAAELGRLGVVDRVHVLPWPIELEVPKGRGDGLLCVARDTPLKGVDRVRRLGAGLGLRVTVAQSQSRAEVLAMYNAHAACALLPRADEDGSGAEGFGVVLLEAAARAVPAIGCRTGGVPDATGPGLLLEDPDEPDLELVHRFLADPQAGARARAWIEKAHGQERALAVLREALGV